MERIKIQIMDDADDWMEIHIDGEIQYMGHMSSFGNAQLVQLLSVLMPDAEINYRTDVIFDS